MSRRANREAFTLIELLVVVAVIALLVSILLPSFARVRDQANTVLCQSNIRQLLVAALMYGAEARGLLPGTSYDAGIDWLGGGNFGHGKSGRQPQDGVIWKYMGQQVDAYKCPIDRRSQKFYYSYTANSLLSGARPESVVNAHYRERDRLGYSEYAHQANLKAIPAMLFIEEDPEYNMLRSTNSGWDNTDGLVQRHMGKKFGNVGNVDCSVAKHQLPPKPRSAGAYFMATGHCIRTKNKYVTGLAWDWPGRDPSQSPNGYYGILHRVPDARYFGVRH